MATDHKLLRARIGALSHEVRQDFPILSQEVGGFPLVYLDSASSSQRPRAVIDAMSHHYETTHANVNRGVYSLAERSTAAYAAARARVASFIGATDPREVIFTKNVTESINLVARSLARARTLGPGDAVLVTEMEHHSNLIPWFMLKEDIGIEVRVIPVDGKGQLALDDLDRLLAGVKLVAVTSVSNVLGTINPVRQITDAAHRAGALVLMDNAQHAPHMPVDVHEAGADFLAFTGHKMLGPTGIGVLWGRHALLQQMPPAAGGGSMIADVTLDGFTSAETPERFEAGTPPIAEAIGLAAAASYLDRLGMETVRRHEVDLTRYALAVLKDRHGDRLTIYGPHDAEQRGGLISFTYHGIHPHDVSEILSSSGVCVRAGHHCAKPLMRKLGVAATTRASFYVYNDERDADALVEALDRCAKIFG